MERNVAHEEQLAQADAFVALRVAEEDNIIASVLAKTIGVTHVMSVVESDMYLDLASHIGVDRIFEWNRDLADLLIVGLDALGAEVVSPRSGPDRTSIVAARFSGTDVDQLAVALDDAGMIASARMGVLRFSPHLYNERDDIARALDTLQRARARSG